MSDIKDLESIDIDGVKTEIEARKVELEIKRQELAHDVRSARKPSITGLWIPVLAASIAAGISALSSWSVANSQKEIAEETNQMSGRLGELEIELGNRSLQQDETEAQLQREDRMLALRESERRLRIEFENNLVLEEQPVILEALSLPTVERYARLCVLDESNLLQSDPAVEFFRNFRQQFDCKTMQDILPNGQIADNSTAVSSGLATGSLEWCREKRSTAVVVSSVSDKGTRANASSTIELRPSGGQIFLSSQPLVAIDSLRGILAPDPRQSLQQLSDGESSYFSAQYGCRNTQPIVPTTCRVSVRLASFEYPSQCSIFAAELSDETPS